MVDQHRPEAPLGLTRRHFLGISAAAMGVAAAGGGLAACSQEPPLPTGVISSGVDLTSPYPKVPGPPDHVPVPGHLQWFTTDEAEALDALMAVMLPGSPADPGAREAGVLTYLDNKLATVPGGVAVRHYSLGPFAEKVPAGKALPPSDEHAVYVPEDAWKRFGPQSQNGPPHDYRKGLASLDALAKATGGTKFADLPAPVQEQIVGSLADDSAKGFDSPGAQDFFNLVRGDIVEGLLSDPVYGGNRGMAGWKLVGYPGAQRGYPPEYVQGHGPELPPQSLMDMPHFHPGQPDGSNVVLPVSGSRGGHEGEEHQGR
jgi:gluconate 2-dehydrogenase gamma chain